MSKTFRRLVEQHRDRVYTFAFYNLGNREEAEDVTQEVMLRLWRFWEGLEEARLGAWLTRVTKNACIDAMRKRRAYRTRIVANVANGENETLNEGVSNEPSPFASASAANLRDHIQRALMKIEEPYRSVIILREIQDMKYEQIADSTDLPLNTVKSYLHRGRKMLRDQLRGIMRHDSI